MENQKADIQIPEDKTLKTKNRYNAQHLSKRRYNAISKKVMDILNDQETASAIMRTICEEMNYDPNVGRYTPELGKIEADRKKRLAEEKGVSLYVLNNRKAYYERKKQEKLMAENKETNV